MRKIEQCIDKELLSFYVELFNREKRFFTITNIDRNHELAYENEVYLEGVSHMVPDNIKNPELVLYREEYESGVSLTFMWQEGEPR